VAQVVKEVLAGLLHVRFGGEEALVGAMGNFLGCGSAQAFVFIVRSFTTSGERVLFSFTFLSSFRTGACRTSKPPGPSAGDAITGVPG
jgi:hypothetical protein